MGKALLALVGAALVGAVVGECQNGCSGAGQCSQHDQCVCYQGHRGNACEKRVCPFGKAWVTTPNGDLNFDGDLHDAALYDASTEFTKKSNYALQQHMAGGSFEMWPSYGAQGEGHFMMECSNMGICDQDTGSCACFDGFEGAACDRMSCPGGNTCNGHGRCMTIEQQLANAGSSVAYTLWDKDMARRCVCDPGYQGIDCTQRVCPTGDDPLTKVFQIDDTQVIDIWSEDVTALGNALQNDLGGSFKLTFTSLQGHKFTTDSIAFSRYTGSGTLAADTKAALEALPNGVIPSVTVTAGFCESFVAGVVAANANPWVPSGALGAGWYRCPGIAGQSNTLVNSADAQSFAATPTAITTGSATEYGCTKVTYPRCSRLTVQFTDAANSGSQNLLEVDHSLVTLAGFTNAGSDRSTADDIKSSVAKNIDLVLGSSTTAWGYTAAATNSKTGLIDRVGGLNAQTSVVVDTAGATTGETFPAGSTVTITCATGKSMGDFIVATTLVNAGAAFTIVLTHAVVDPHGYCANNAAIVIQGKTNFISVSADLSGSTVTSKALGLQLFSTAAGTTTKTVATTALNGLTSLAFAAAGVHGATYLKGSVVSITCAGQSVGYYTVTTDVTSDANALALVVSSAVSDPNGYCAVGASASIVGQSTDVKSTVSSITFTTDTSYLLLTESPVDPRTGAAMITAPKVTRSGDPVKIVGASTKESSVCSDRGNCDFETGECACFKGYSGEACQNQNALWLGA